MAPPLRQHQIEGIEFLTRKKRCVLADDMGLGKTCQVITSLRQLGRTQNLIICPKSAKEVWRREIKLWWPGATDKDIIVVGEQKFAERERLLKKKSLFTIVNYAHIHTYSSWITDDNGKKIQTQEDLKHLPTLQKVMWGSITFDEAHKLRNRQSKSFKAAKSIVRVNPGIPVYPTTGTPVFNKVIDIWPLLHLIEPKVYSSFWRFVDEHCEQIVNPYTGYKGIGGVLDPAKLKAELTPLVLRRAKRDVLDLPPLTFEYVPLQMDDDHREGYENMLEKMFIEWRNKEIDAPSILAQLTRLKQICLSPDLLLPNMTTLSGAKFEWIDETLEGLGDQKAIIFSQWSTCITRLVSRVGKKYGKAVTFTGQTPYALRNLAVKAIQEDDASLLLTTTQCGESYTVTSASIAIFLDLLWAPAANGQAISRIDRMGQKNPMTIYIPYIADTIEEQIIQMLSDKQAMFNSIIPEKDVRDVAINVWKDGLNKWMKKLS